MDTNLQQTEQELPCIGSLHYRLPVDTCVLRAVKRSIQESQYNMAAVASEIEKDPGITSAVLSLANSGFFGMPRYILYVRQACNILGLNQLSRMMQRLENQSPKITRHETDTLKHLRLTSLLCEFLATQAGADAALAKLMGLLHDIGELINDSNSKAEIENLEHGHFDCELIESLGLPQQYTDALRYHHGNTIKYDQLIAILRLADQFACFFQGNSEFENKEIQLKSLWKLANLSCHVICNKHREMDDILAHTQVLMNETLENIES